MAKSTKNHGRSFIGTDSSGRLVIRARSKEEAERLAKEKLKEIYEKCPLWKSKPKLINRFVSQTNLTTKQTKKQNEKVVVDKMRWKNKRSEAYRTNELWDDLQ